MRVLGASVLVIEAIIVFLASLVAGGTGAVADVGTSMLVGGVLAILLIVGAGLMGRPVGVIVGWVLQAFVLAWGFWVPAMWVVGGIFALLWFYAVRNGTRIDELRAQRSREADG